MPALSTRKRCGGAVALSMVVVAGALALGGQASAHKGKKDAHGSVRCSGVAPASVAHDLVVPAGGSCTILAGTSVGHDVVVQSGATLIDEGGQVRHDVRADKGAGIGIGGGTGPNGELVRGSVRHDVSLSGVSGAGPGPSGVNYVCSTDVGHDLVVAHSSASAGEWVIGDADPDLCSQGVKVGHDLRAQDNANHLDVSDNNAPSKWAIGHDLNVQGSGQPPMVESNTVRHDASCESDHARDGDGSPNTAGHHNSCG